MNLPCLRTGDYRLTNESNAISSGRNSISENFELSFRYTSFFYFNVSGDDVHGNPRVRPNGSVVDIGAHENAQGVPGFEGRKYNVLLF